MKIEPLIVVKDVPASSRFYQQLLGCDSAHGGDEYEMLTYKGSLLLQLHRRDAHEHPGMWNAEVANGNGVLLWFRTNEFAAAVERVKQLSPDIVQDAHINPNARQHEIWFRDLDGYLLVISDNFGDAD